MRSYLSVLLWAAVALLVLVVIIPLTSRQKPPKELSKKPAADRGAVVKEIPKAPQPIAESVATRRQDGVSEKPITEEPKKAGEAPPTPPSSDTSQAVKQIIPKEKAPPAQVPASEMAPRMVEAPPASPAPEPVAKTQGGTTVSKPTQPPVAAPSAPQQPSAPDAVSSQKPKTAALQPSTQAPKTPSTQAQNTPPASSGSKQTTPGSTKGLYAVQVASFTDKAGAEEMKKNLEKKGYKPELKTVGNPKEGQKYIVLLPPVDNQSKAYTQLEQVKYIPKAKPSIVPVSGGN